MILPLTFGLALALWDGRPAPSALDLEHACAVEAFVMSVVQPDGRLPKAPEPYRTLIAATGDPCYRHREMASKRLHRSMILASRDQPYRWLFWGMRDRDPEVSIRCLAILKRLFACDSCGGKGGTTSKWSDDFDRCGTCWGRGRAWRWSAWE